MSYRIDPLQCTPILEIYSLKEIDLIEDTEGKPVLSFHPGELKEQDPVTYAKIIFIFQKSLQTSSDKTHTETLDRTQRTPSLVVSPDVYCLEKKFEELVGVENAFEEKCLKLQQRHYSNTPSLLGNEFKQKLYKFYYLTQRMGQPHLFNRVVEFPCPSLGAFESYFQKCILNDLLLVLEKVEPEETSFFVESYLNKIQNLISNTRVEHLIHYCLFFSFRELIDLFEKNPLNTQQGLTDNLFFKHTLDLKDPLILLILKIQTKLPLKESKLTEGLLYLGPLMPQTLKERGLDYQKLLEFCQAYIENEPSSTLQFLIRVASFAENEYTDLATLVQNFPISELPKIFPILNDILDLEELNSRETLILLELESKLCSSSIDQVLQRELIDKIDKHISSFENRLQGFIWEWINAYLRNVVDSAKSVPKEYLEIATLAELRFIENALLYLSKIERTSSLPLAFELATIFPEQILCSLSIQRRFDESSMKCLVNLSRVALKEGFSLLETMKRASPDWESLPKQKEFERRWETRVSYEKKEWSPLSCLLEEDRDLEGPLLLMPAVTFSGYTELIERERRKCTTILRVTYCFPKATKILFDELEEELEESSEESSEGSSKNSSKGELSLVDQFLLVIKKTSDKTLINLMIFLEFEEKDLCQILINLLLNLPSNVNQAVIEALIDKSRLLEPQILQEVIEILQDKENSGLKRQLIDLLLQTASAKKITDLLERGAIAPPPTPLDTPPLASEEEKNLVVSTLSALRLESNFQTQLTLILAQFLLLPHGSINFSIITPIIETLTLSKMNEAQKQRIIYILECLQKDLRFSSCLQELKAPEGTSPLCLLIRKMLKKDASLTITDQETRIVVLSALLTPTRQASIGSCFATSLLIQQESYLLGLLQKLKDLCYLIQTDNLERSILDEVTNMERTILVPVFVSALLEEAELETDHLLNRALEFTIASFDTFARSHQTASYNRFQSLVEYFCSVFSQNLSNRIPFNRTGSTKKLFEQQLSKALSERCQLNYIGCMRAPAPSEELGGWALTHQRLGIVENFSSFRLVMKDLLEEIRRKWSEEAVPYRQEILLALSKTILFIESPLLEGSQSQWDQFRGTTRPLFAWYDGGRDDVVRQLFFSSNLPKMTFEYQPSSPKHNFLMMAHMMSYLPDEVKAIVRENPNLKIPFSFPGHACCLTPDSFLNRGQLPMEVLTSYEEVARDWLARSLDPGLIAKLKQSIVDRCFPSPSKELLQPLEELETADITSIQAFVDHFYEGMMRRGIALNLIEYHIDDLMVFFWKEPDLEAKMVSFQVGDTNWKDREILAFMPHPLSIIKEVVISWDFIDIDILSISGPSKVCSFAPFPSLTQE